ncbi:MAG TPA: bifunctional DNA primase/polymerase [Phycisphaerae bacterium]|nr:bifunctional DNA primase/polymerase [Phycisphaerae bacterium]
MNDAARKWIEYGHGQGWAFTPLAGKRPIHGGWQTAPRADLATTLAWAERGNVGIRTGAASGVVIVDIDPEADLTQLAGELPATVEAITGRGGRHLYYRAPDRPVKNSVGKLAAHVDVRGDRGQAVFVGSVHPETGRVYEWKYDPVEYAMADLPEWIANFKPSVSNEPETLHMDVYTQTALQSEVSAVRAAGEGARNDTLNTAAFNLGQLVGGGSLDRRTVEIELTAAAMTVGLPEAESRATICSGLDAGVQTPRTPPEPACDRRATTVARVDPDATVLVPGPHTDADGVYREVSSPMFAAAVLTRLPDDSLYRKGHIPGEVLGEPGKRRFVEIQADAGRLLIDQHMRLGAWYASKKHGDPEAPERVCVYKPANRDNANLVIAAARTSPRVRELKLLVSYPVYGPGFERLPSGWRDGVFYDEPTELASLEPETDIEAIRGVLEELVVDFPFKDEASRQNFFGLMLTPIVAPAIAGNRPMHLMLSPIERTGKTKLAEEVFGGVILGRPTPALQIAGHDEERDKRILALLMLGETTIHLDNLPPSVSSAALASMLTATTYQGRLLGASRVVEMPNTLTVVGSGNNTECSGEIAKRSVPILLEPRISHPELRDDFHHRDLRAHVQNRRRDILAALLGMVETWKANNRPGVRLRMGGFEAWSETVGGIMHSCGFNRWRENSFAWTCSADPDGQEVATFVGAWAEAHGSRLVTASELTRTALDADLFGADLDKRNERGQATAMGAKLRRMANRPVGEWIVRRVESAGSRPAQYYLEGGR